MALTAIMGSVAFGSSMLMRLGCWLLVQHRQTRLIGCGTCSLSDGGGLRKASGEGLLHEGRHKSLGLLEKHLSNALIMQRVWAREPASEMVQ